MRKWNIGWGPVSHCNMECQFCYSKYRRKDIKDLKYKDWKKFIDQNQAYIASINYGTGENTLDRDWFRLTDYIRVNYPEIRQALTTNGYLSEAVKNKEHLDIFIRSLDEIDVSLDFSDEEKHGELRGQPKAYQWALKTLELCQTYAKQATMVFLGSKVNLYKENIMGYSR